MLAHLRKDSIDMLILDWQVADMGGADVLRRAQGKAGARRPDRCS